MGLQYESDLRSARCFRRMPYIHKVIFVWASHMLCLILQDSLRKKSLPRQCHSEPTEQLIGFIPSEI